jgi:hypothetical protein
MGITVFPEPSAASKTMRRTTLTSGTSFTVPAGVTFVNVTLYGGGGGGGGVGISSAPAQPGAGGTTTFTGATSATGGNAGHYSFANSNNTTVHAVSPGTAGKTNTGEPGLAGQTYTPSDKTGYIRGIDGSWGQVISSTVTTTPGASVTYGIGGGGAGGAAANSASEGGAGGSGFIVVEYWI